MKIKFWISALAIIAISNFTMAQETPATQEKGTRNTRTERPAFVDNNKDGICDNAGTKQGNGNCDGTGKGQIGQKGKGNHNGNRNCKRNGSCRNL